MDIISCSDFHSFLVVIPAVFCVEPRRRAPAGVGGGETGVVRAAPVYGLGTARPIESAADQL